MSYGAHEYFVAPARERAEWWRVAAGIVLAFVAGIALYQLAIAVMATLLGPAMMQALWDEATFSGDTARGTLFALFSFAFFALGLGMGLRALHERGIGTLMGPWEAVLSDFIRVVMAASALYAVVLILVPPEAGMVRNATMPKGVWFALLPLSLLAIAVQAGTEELFFRGYLQQQIAARLPWWPAWMLVPAILFGVLHWSGDAAGPNAVYFALWAIAFGIAAADLTARTGTLGAAFGLHFANNAFAVLGISLAGPGSGLALWHLPFGADAPQVGAMIPVELATLFVAWLPARLALKV